MVTAIKACLKLCRVSNLPTVWSNVIAAALLVEVPITLPVSGLLLFSLSLFYCGGMALNDICDADHDRRYQTFRPIPSGEIPFARAVLLTAVLFAGAFLALLAVPHPREALMAGAVLLLLIVSYDLFHKAHPVTVLLMAACRFMIYVTASVALTGKIHWSIISLALLQFGYILLLSLVARFESPRGDVLILPPIPLLLACIPLLDGLYLAIVKSLPLLFVGVFFMLLTLVGQRFVRGD